MADIETMIHQIKEWAESANTKFDISFIDDIDLQYSSGEEITLCQENAVINIYERWRIRDWHNKKKKKSFRKN